MSLPVRYSRRAAIDLKSIRQWIAREADLATADAYLDRLRDRCRKLRDFSEQGTPRDALGAGLRSIAFERRVVIFYRVETDAVRIVRVLSAARDVHGLLAN